MRTLPRNISTHHSGGYLVRIWRGATRYTAVAATLDEAIRLRHRFFTISGALGGYSNTGVTGISETTHWQRSRSTPCFVVHWKPEGKPRRTARIIFGQRRTRAEAFRAAVALRRSKVPQAYMPEVA